MKQTNVLSNIAKRYLKACHKITMSSDAKVLSLNGVLSTLTTVHKRPDLIYEVLTPSTTNHGGISFCYARRRNIPALHYDTTSMFQLSMKELPEGYISIEESLDWTFSPQGVWEWTLIKDLWVNLPLWWHANYSKIDYILDLNDYSRIVPKMPPPFEITGLSQDPSILPTGKYKDDNHIEVSFCIWNAWSGLSRITYLATRNTDGSISLSQTGDELLIKYDCGIRY